MPGDACPRDGELHARMRMVGCAAGDEPLAGLGVHILKPLALPQRVDRHDDKTGGRKIDADRLVNGVRLAAVRMPMREDDRRCRRLYAVRDIQRRRDIEVRDAFIDQLLDAEPASLEDSCYAGVQRSPLCRQAAERFEIALLDSASARLKVGYACDLRPLPFLSAKMRLRPPAQVLRHLICNVMVPVDMRSKNDHEDSPSLAF